MTVLAQTRLRSMWAGTLSPSGHDPHVEVWSGGALIGVFVVGLICWASIARLDSAVHAPGLVRVDGNRQAVQSPDAGVITAINVHEGDHVRAGQVLVDFAATEPLSQERSLASRVIGLQAEIARIGTEQGGGAQIPTPAEWAGLTGAEREDANRALASEQANLLAKRALLKSERAVLSQRLTEVGDQIGGYHGRQSANARQSVLNREELETVQQLYSKGYAPKTRVLALQRSAASIDSDIGSAQSEIARLRSSAGETRLQMMQLADQREQENSDRLRTAHTELDTLLPQWKAAREQLARSSVRAPVAGTVLGLAVNTIGGFATAGQKLLEVVPEHAALEIEARVAVADANDLRPGQPTNVQIQGLRGRKLPVVHGVVSRVSADRFEDEHSGRPFFTATISVPRAELDRISRDAEIGGTIKPGTPVDVIVPLKARTALQYWLGPLSARLRPAFTEQ